MTLDTLAAWSPVIVTLLGAIVVLASIVVRRSHGVARTLTAGSFLTGASMVPLVWSEVPTGVTSLLEIDRLGLSSQALILLAATGVCVMARDYLSDRHQPEEFYVLALLSTSGAATLTVSSHFASFLLGLELLTIPLFGMIAYLRRGEDDLRAAIQYFVLAAATSASLLFGMALVYASTGTMTFPGIFSAQASALTFVGASLMVVSIGFKLGLAPFHMWVSDVYEGSPSPVTALIASVSKAGVLVVLVRLLLTVEAAAPLHLTFAAIAALSMIVGNVLALREVDVKRILAYSSIAHFGYLLLPILAGDVDALFVYLAAYVLTIVGAFGAIAALSSCGLDAHELGDYRGLFWRRPLLGTLFGFHLLSLAGIPLTAGFIGKFYVFLAAADGGRWILAIVFALTSVIGLFYYLRVIYTMFDAETAEGARPPASRAAMFIVFTTALLIFLIGVWPSPIIGLLG